MEEFHQAQILIRPVIGGFIVEYPKRVLNEDGSTPIYFPMVTEVATSVGKAMKIARTAAEEFSLVKSGAEASEA